MDCNKDEAIRAKELAEKKMANNDFEGARTIVLKAQKLYTELDITQFLSICDVHCSAQNMMIGSEKDWYAILQVDRLADDLTVKKQYRRMALLLHPDKNRLPGAEAAFKLISEANAVLSDSTKKSLYDARIRASALKKLQPPSHHMNKNSQCSGLQNNVTNGFGNLNQYKANLFWTFCPGCKARYQFEREHVNKNIHCKKCFKSFFAFEISGDGVPIYTKPAAQVPSKFGSGQVGAQSVKGRSSSYAGSQENINSKPVQPEDISTKPVQQETGIKTGSNCKGINVANAFGQPSAQVPSKPDSSQPAVIHEKVVVGLSQGFSKVGVHKLVHSASHEGSQDNTSTTPIQPEPAIVIGSNRQGILVANAFSGNEDPKANESSTKYKDGENEPRDRKKNKKRSRKMERESRESFDSSDCDFEFVTITTYSTKPAPDVNSKRRSSIQKQNISYNETSDDDFVLSKKLKEREKMDTEDLKLGNQKSFSANTNCSKSVNKDKGTARFEESLQEKHATIDKEGKVGGDINSGVGNGTKSAAVESDSDLDLDSGDDSDVKSDSDLELYSADDSIGGNTYECPDTEFYDFEKERDGVPFKVGQVWACYDDSDSMPRFYAKVMKVNSSPFQLSFKWLEADPTNEAHEGWLVGCGTFKLGRKIEYTSTRNIFSHQMTNCLPSKKRGSLIIYPKTCETWALFKKWNPETGKEFEYEVVEVLSDFADGVGVKVCYLDKIDGHVSIFQKAGQIESFVIGPDELHRFSHRVPSFKLNSCDGVPTGSFELDPASLPLNPGNLHFPGKAKKESGRMDFPPPKSADDNVPVKSARTINVIDLDSD